MIRWAGWLMTAIGVGHMLIALTMTAPEHADAWFTGEMWDDDLTQMDSASGAYWLTLGSFGIPQIMLGQTVLWLNRRGITPPQFIAWTQGANTLLGAWIFFPSPWPVDLIGAVLLLVGIRRANRDAARKQHGSPGAVDAGQSAGSSV